MGAQPEIKSQIGILKSLWSRQADGRWGVTDMKDIKLKPTQGCEPDFFTLAGDIQLMTTRPRGMNLGEMLTTFGSTEFLLKQSIFPVVAWCDGDDLIRTVGTAFAISSSGYVMTAGHVLMDPFEEGYGAARQGEAIVFADDLNIGVFIPTNPAGGSPGVRFCPFTQWSLWAVWQQSPLLHEPPRSKLLIDIAICKIPEMTGGASHQPLHLSLNPFVRGEATYSIGYARMEPIPIEYVNGEPRFKEFQARLHVSVGEAMQNFSQNHMVQTVPTPGPCFDYRAKIPGKMSGGPILGAEGAVVRGVVSWSDEQARHAYGAMLEPVMDLPLADGRTLRSLMQEGNEGIAQVRGRGL